MKYYMLASFSRFQTRFKIKLNNSFVMQIFKYVFKILIVLTIVLGEDKDKSTG